MFIKTVKVILCGLFVWTSHLFYAQDLIVKRDSSVIFCKISMVDSTTIYYRQSKGEQTIELSIPKTNIISFYKKNAPIVAETLKADTIAKIQPKIDTSQTKKDSLQPKAVVATFKKDSVQTKTAGLKPQGDSIFLNRSYKCFYKGELITRKEAFDLMKKDTTAQHEMKKARAYFAPVIPLGLGAAVLAGVFIGDALSGNFQWWAVGGGCVLLSAVAITCKHAFNIHIANAIKLNNTHNRLSLVGTPKYELGMASKGVGISFKF